MLSNLYASFVNLDSRPDRLAHMNEQIKGLPFNVERTRGIPWREVQKPKIDEMLRRKTPGAIGCHFSQVSIMERALELGKHALVMEDDIVFCKDFNKRFEYIQDWCSKNEWDVFYLGSAVHISDKDAPYWHPIGRPSKMGGCKDVSANLGYDAKRTDDPRIIQTFGAFDTFAYLVNKDSLRKVLDMLDQFLPNSIGIDFNMIYWQPRGMKSFAFLPGLVRQMTNKSDIGDGITHWDNFLNLGPYVFQENMEDFNPSTFNFGVCEK